MTVGVLIPGTTGITQRLDAPQSNGPALAECIHKDACQGWAPYSHISVGGWPISISEATQFTGACTTGTVAQQLPSAALPLPLYSFPIPPRGGG